MFDDKIETEQQFYAELEQLSSSLSYTDSIRVGEYLLGYKSLSEIKSMLSDDSITPLERQAILMAIQDLNRRESERYLASIVIDSELPDRYCAAGMVNLSYIKDATFFLMDVFVDVLAQNEASLLTETALLNIGILAREQTQLTNRGIDIVTNALSNPEATPKETLTALRAAANLYNNTFTPSFVEAMKFSDSAFERTVAGALYRPDARSEAVERLMTEKENVVFTTASKFFSTHEISFMEQNKFYDRLVNEPEENSQSSLVALLLSNESQRPVMLEKLTELSAVWDKTRYSQGAASTSTA